MYEITVNTWKHECTSIWFVNCCAIHYDTMCHPDDVAVRHSCAFDVVGDSLKAETPMELLSIECPVLNNINILTPS